jgi:hypothetical protein
MEKPDDASPLDWLLERLREEEVRVWHISPTQQFPYAVYTELTEVVQ